MFQAIIEQYRRLAGQHLSDAEDLESGRWRIGDRDGDRSHEVAGQKRGLAARLLGLAKVYEDLKS